MPDIRNQTRVLEDKLMELSCLANGLAETADAFHDACDEKKIGQVQAFMYTLSWMAKQLSDTATDVWGVVGSINLKMDIEAGVIK